MRLLCFVVLAAARLAQAALPEYLPPDTKVVISLNIRGLIDSPLLKDVAGARGMAAPYIAGTPLAGLDPLKDLDELVIASTGEGEKAPALVVLRGRFPAGLLPGGPIHQDPKTPTSSYALLDANTLIAGDTALVRAALDARGKSSPLSAALAERIAALEGRYDVWAVGEIPKGIHTSAAPSPEIEAIDRFDFGVSLRQGLNIAGQVHVRTAKDTEKLMQTMKLLEMMVAMQPKTANSASKFELKSGENTISLSVFIPEEELKKSIEAQKQQFASSTKTSFGVAPPPPPPTPGSMVKNEHGDTVTVTLPRK